MILPICLLALVASVLGRSVESPDPYDTYGSDSITVEAATQARNGRQIFLDSAGQLFFALPLPAKQPFSLSVKKGDNQKVSLTPPQSCFNDDGKVGIPMSADDCYPYLRTFNKTVLKEVIMQAHGRYPYYNRKSQRAETGVCCTSRALRMQSYPSLETPTDSTTAQDDAEEVATKYEQFKRQSLPTSCGKRGPSAPKIVGGQAATPGEWPWMAALTIDQQQFCGGSLIDNLHILTAAHCVEFMTSLDVARLLIRLNEYNLKDPSELKTLILRVRRITSHGYFIPFIMINDIAIITLDKPVNFGPGISPVCLPKPTDKNSYAGKTAVVTGWGILQEGGQQPDVLMEVSVAIITNQQCNKNYDDTIFWIFSSMMCAGNSVHDSCAGDSGGPMVVQGTGGWVQVGIVSWGFGCAHAPYSGVYTRVTSFMKWILTNLN